MNDDVEGEARRRAHSDTQRANKRVDDTKRRARKQKQRARLRSENRSTKPPLYQHAATVWDSQGQLPTRSAR